MRRGAIALGWAAMMLAASCEQPRTELVVRVDSELAWGPGQRVQSVLLTVRREGAAGPLRSARTTALGTDGERRPLPLLVGVTAGDDTETPVWIEALGCGDPNGCTAATAVVAQRAVVRFARGQTQEVTLLLASACVGVSCGSEQRCEVSSGRCEAATQAQEMVRPFSGSDAATVTVVDATEADGPKDAEATTNDVQPTKSSDAGTAKDVPAHMDAFDEATDVVTDAWSPDDLLDGADAEIAVDALVDSDMVGDRTDISSADDRPPTIDAGFDGSAPDVAADLGADLGADVTCSVPLMPCSGVCRNLQVDAANCGACGHDCATGMVCAAGACASTCVSGTTYCGGSCVSLSNDARNCGGCGNACSSGQSCVGGSCVVSPPPNDTCGGAQEISFATPDLTINGTNLGATASITPPCGYGVTTDVYYRFTVPGPSRELVYADTAGSSFDTVLYFARDCGTVLSASTTAGDVVCNDDMASAGCNGGLQSQVVALLNPGTWYLMVGGYGGQTGSISLRFQHLPVGSGGVAVLPAGSTMQAGSTSGSGSMGGPCGGASAGESTWWWRTCPDFAGGGFSAQTCGRASWNTLIYLRNGSGSGECNDDACGLQSSISATLPPGPGIHAFTVDGFGANTGSFSVVLSRP